MKKAFFWILAILITLAAIIYQRKTGPTYDKKFDVEVNGKRYKIKLARSMEIGSGPAVKLSIDDKKIKAKLFYKRFLTKDDYTPVDFEYDQKPIDSFIMNKVFGITEEKGWFAKVPDQPMAGKIQYYFEVTDGNGSKVYLENEPVVVRFKGAVPASVLIPHIFFMFFAMLLGNLAGIMAIFRHKRYKFYTNLTVIALFIGGMFLGPWVQWHAFGEAWAGVPFCVGFNRQQNLGSVYFLVTGIFYEPAKTRPVYTIVASIVMLIIYSIPHSMYGSQLDPETGEIIQGWIQLFVF